MGNPNTTGEVRCGTILKVAGPLIVATGMSNVRFTRKRPGWDRASRFTALANRFRWNLPRA